LKVSERNVQNINTVDFPQTAFRGKGGNSKSFPEGIPDKLFFSLLFGSLTQVCPKL
jgi:hypothetical protein